MASKEDLGCVEGEKRVIKRRRQRRRNEIDETEKVTKNKKLISNTRNAKTPQKSNKNNKSQKNDSKKTENKKSPIPDEVIINGVTYKRVKERNNNKANNKRTSKIKQEKNNNNSTITKKSSIPLLDAKPTLKQKFPTPAYSYPDKERSEGVSANNFPKINEEQNVDGHFLKNVLIKQEGIATKEPSKLLNEKKTAPENNFGKYNTVFIKPDPEMENIKKRILEEKNFYKKVNPDRVQKKTGKTNNLPPPISSSEDSCSCSEWDEDSSICSCEIEDFSCSCSDCEEESCSCSEYE